MISDEYRAVLRESHAAHENWGTSAGKHAQVVLQIIKQIKPTTILDYGCGKGMLFKTLNNFDVIDGIEGYEYDPAIPGRSIPPINPFDLVCCIDVLEHIEPEHLNDVLGHLKRLTKFAGYFLISTRKASHVLPDGRNAHLIVEGRKWWEEKIQDFFPQAVFSFSPIRQELHVMVGGDMPDIPNVEKPKGMWL